MDSRREGRYPVDAPGMLRVVGVVGAVYIVTVLDVSKSGLRISCSVAFPAGTRIEVHCRGARVSGEVRYSRHVSSQEFYLGIQADEASEGARGEGGETDLTLLFDLRPK